MTSFVGVGSNWSLELTNSRDAFCDRIYLVIEGAKVRAIAGDSESIDEYVGRLVVNRALPKGLWKVFRLSAAPNEPAIEVELLAKGDLVEYGLPPFKRGRTVSSAMKVGDLGLDEPAEGEGGDASAREVPKEKAMMKKNDETNTGLPHLSDETFEKEVLKAKVPALVDFTATWCGPCRSLAPILESVAPEYSGRMKLGKVDVDDCPATSSRYQVKSVPTLLVFHGGKVVGKSVGLISRATLKSFLDTVLEQSGR
jgi:thioredoxin 1